ncbi:MAG: hypothetical protein ACJA1Z_000595 [Patiriisocius sp.]|jgi:hypothetical protein
MLQGEDFLLKEELEIFIDISIDDIIDLLDEFVEIKGLLADFNNELTYVDGYFYIEELEDSCPTISYEDADLMTMEGDIKVTTFIKKVKGSKYSNNLSLVDNIYSLKTYLKLDEPVYSCDQLNDVAEKLKIPIKDLSDPNNKIFLYDRGNVNQKSNFTLIEASRIAANAPLQDQQGIFYCHATVKHYQELLSECVKGQNQHAFHLITKELWCHSYTEDIGECSTRCKNGVPLKVSAMVNLELTIISKAELLRWCKYMDIETGLYYQQKIIEESINALKIKLNESEIEISRLRDLYINEPDKEIQKNITYPPELQLALDAYEQLCLNQEKPPTNEYIKNWLQKESKGRGITHKDGGRELKGFSDIKLKTIPSIIKSQ